MVGWITGKFFVPKLLWNLCNTIGNCKASKFIWRSKSYVVTSIGKYFSNRVSIKGARIGKARATIFDDTNPDALALRAHEVLDLAFVNANVGLDTASDVGLDLLATPVTGAYGHSMGSNYNKITRPPVVFVSAGDARLVVRRETYADLLATDVF